MRVILVADNASIRFGGEAFIPFNYFRLLLNRNVDVHLVVHARNRTELSERFPEHLDRLSFVDDIWLHKALFRFGTYLPRRFADATTGLLLHLTTQWVQKRIIHEIDEQEPVDVIHQPIPVSPKTPSQIFALGAPVIIGPLNGGMNYPPAFEKERGAIVRTATAVGRGISNLFNFLIPGKRLASLVLVANQRTRAALPWGVRGRVVELVENGVDLAIWEPKKSDPDERSALHLIFVGRLIDWKALEIVLEAIARASKHLIISFEVIGDGPMRQTWQAAAKHLGLESAVKFSGFFSQAECARRLQAADVLCCRVCLNVGEP
jgi:glycosyltransferase involved in cell wall biosynthesis